MNTLFPSPLSGPPLHLVVDRPAGGGRDAAAEHVLGPPAPLRTQVGQP